VGSGDLPASEVGKTPSDKLQ